LLFKPALHSLPLSKSGNDFLLSEVILLRKATQDKIPIAKCANPECGCSILYSNNPREKRNVTVRMAEPNYTGPIFMCPRCKKMLVVIEKPKVAAGYVALPVIQSV
jgi:hypothetical protein